MQERLAVVQQQLAQYTAGGRAERVHGFACVLWGYGVVLVGRLLWVCGGRMECAGAVGRRGRVQQQAAQQSAGEWALWVCEGVHADMQGLLLRPGRRVLSRVNEFCRVGNLCRVRVLCRRSVCTAAAVR